MKIGLVSQPYYPILGGVTEHVWHVGQELRRRGHEVTVITGGGLGVDDRGLRVLRIGRQVPLAINGAHVHITIGYKLGRQLRRIEAAERFDVVHIQSPLDPFLPLAATMAMRSPKVGTHHTFRERNPLFSLFPGHFRRAVHQFPIHIAVSHSAESLVTKYYPDVTFRIVPNGIDTERFSPDVQPLDAPGSRPFTVLFVGRMDPRKGARFLFAAIPYLEQALHQYRILVVGAGWLRRYYDKYIPLTLQHRVQFAGKVSAEDLPRYYRSADVFCSPATHGESFGLILLEAMASAVPVVASDIEGYRWVVEPGKQGLLVPAKSARLLALAIVRLAQDDALRKAFGQAGRAKALQYTWKSVVDRLEPLYEEARVA